MNRNVQRRPIGARRYPWIQATARWLAHMGIRPNQISVMSVVFSAMSATCLIFAGSNADSLKALLYVLAAAFIPMRALCNICDGLLAVEGGLKTNSGAIYNDLPDLFSDSLLFIAAGYSINWLSWGNVLGWATALASITVTSVRLLGKSAGASPQFCGPMAKSHRMAVFCAACLASSLETALDVARYAMTMALIVVILGCVVTVVRRTLRIVQELEAT